MFNDLFLKTEVVSNREVLSSGVEDIHFHHIESLLAMTLLLSK